MGWAECCGISSSSLPYAELESREQEGQREEAEPRALTYRRAGVSKDEASKEPRVPTTVQRLVLPAMPH